MDTRSNRTAHIRQWVPEHGGPAAFSRKFGDGKWSPSLVSQWISETKPKPIGHNLARELEEAVGYPAGYMDSQAVRLTGEKLRTAIRLGRGAMAHLGVDTFDVEDPADSEIAAAAFDFLDRRGIVSPTDGDMLAFIRLISEKRSERSILGTPGNPGRSARTAEARKKSAAAGGRKK